MSDRTFKERMDEAVKILELFQNLSDEEKNQCLIYISALADRKLFLNKDEEQ